MDPLVIEQLEFQKRRDGIIDWMQDFGFAEDTFRMGHVRPHVQRVVTPQEAASAQNDTYFHPAAAVARPSSSSWKLGNENILGCRWLWCDLDTELDVSSDAWNEWRSQGTDAALNNDDLPSPRYIVDSGQGLQLWWRISIIESDLPRIESALKLIYSMFEKHGSDPQTTSASNIMRLPYTWHTKTQRWNEVLYSNKNAEDIDLNRLFLNLGDFSRETEEESFEGADTSFIDKFFKYGDERYKYEPHGQFFTFCKMESGGAATWTYNKQENEGGLRRVESPYGERWNIRSNTLRTHLKIPAHCGIDSTFSGLDMEAMTRGLGNTTPLTGGPQGNAMLHKKYRLQIATEKFPQIWKQLELEATSIAKQKLLALTAPEYDDTNPWEWPDSRVRERYYEPKTLNLKGIVHLEHDPSMCYGARSGFRLGLFIKEAIDSAIEIGKWPDGDIAVYYNGVWKPRHDDVDQIGYHSQKTLGDMWRTEVPVQIRSFMANQDDRRVLTGQQPTDYLVNCKSGMIDVRTEEILPHDPEYLSTVQLPVEYAPDATAPKFLSALEMWQPDERLQEALQMIAGACISPATPPQQLYFFWGDGNNGKTTFTNVLISLLGGSEQVATLKPQDFSNKFRPAMLHNKLANIAGDVPPSSLDEVAMATLKDLSGGSPVTVERKYGQPFHVSFNGIFIFSGNLRPIVKDQTHGAFRRLYPVPWTTMLNQTRKIKDYDQVLFKEEAAGILNWCLDGLRKLRAHENTVPEVEPVEEVKDEWVALSDHYSLYLERGCVYAPHHKESVKELYNGLLRFLVREDYFPSPQDAENFGKVSPIALGKRLSALNQVQKHKTSSGNLWKGIAVKDKHSDWESSAV